MSGDQAHAAVAAITGAIPRDAVAGIFLYGSALAGGLRPDSDLDLALVASRRLAAREKEALADAIRPLSRRSLRPPEWRPLEITVLALPDVRPWRYPPLLDMQYGEWLTDTDLSQQVERGPVASPDVAVLITMLRQSSRPHLGSSAADVLVPVPHADIVRATLDAMPTLLADLEGDTRNVLLTMARMWVTVATGTIRSKDDAAAWAADRVPAEHRRILDEARALYLAGGWGEWGATMADVRLLADRLRDEIRRAAASRGIR